MCADPCRIASGHTWTPGTFHFFLSSTVDGPLLGEAPQVIDGDKRHRGNNISEEIDEYVRLRALLKEQQL